MAELIADDIRRDIVTGVLGEGELLPAAAGLMERFGVSTPTVREALRILESEGLIQVRRGASGARVQLPDEGAAGRALGSILQLRGTTLADVTEALLVLEPWFAGRLARSHTDADIDRLRASVAEARTALDDPQAFAARQSAFHRLVAELAGNETMLVFSRLLDGVVQRQTARVDTSDAFRPRLEAALREHEELVDLIAAGRDADAEAHWRTHIEDGAGQLAGDPHTVVDLYARSAELH
jgi:DNA-binding FadR family transcriptional regulator